MKKKWIALLLAGCMAVSMAACGKDGEVQDTETESTSDPVERTPAPEVASAEMELDLDQLVSELCEYKGIEVTITGTYELTQEEMDEIIMQDLDSCQANLVEKAEGEALEEGDVALVDYVGYLDGEAFDRGSAENQYVTLGDGNGYVPGFTNPLIGGKAGENVSGPVTFPDEYSNEDLAGKETTFEFKIHSIYRKNDNLEELKKEAEAENSAVNQAISDAYGAYGIENLEDLIEYETSYVEQTLESNKYTATVTEIKEYLSEKCKVEIPEEYLQARVTEYRISYEEEMLDDTQSLEDYLSENYNGTTVDEAMETWTEYQESQIKTELIFRRIAKEEKIELDEEEFASFISAIVQQAASGNYSFTDETSLYEYYGAGNAANGKKYMEELFVMNKAIDYVYENAKVTIEAPEEETTEE